MDALKADGGGEAAFSDATDGPVGLVETEGQPREQFGRKDGVETERGGSLCQQDMI